MPSLAETIADTTQTDLTHLLLNRYNQSTGLEVTPKPPPAKHN
jgi:hypothetical protein